MVHFRNIWGNRQEFAEVAVDEGVVDMARAMKVYRDSGYDGTILPDHAVQAPNDQGGAQYMAFVYGYINALIKAAEPDGVTLGRRTRQVEEPMDSDQHLQLPPEPVQGRVEGGAGRKSGCGAPSAATSSRRSSRPRASTGFSSIPSTGRTKCPASCRNSRPCPPGPRNRSSASRGTTRS